MPEGTPSTAGSGVMKYHLRCVYHDQLGVFDSDADANAAAAEHIKKLHADSQGNVAKAAEVEISAVRHFSADDAASAQNQPSK